MAMLKLKEREFSSEDAKETNVDVVVLSDNGSKVFYNTPCVINYENYPNNEDSYSVNIWWSQAEETSGVAPKYGFPNEPYKSYFTHFHYSKIEDTLDFYNIWKEEIRVFIYRRTDNTENKERIAEVIQKYSAE